MLCKMLEEVIIPLCLCSIDLHLLAASPTPKGNTALVFLFSSTQKLCCGTVEKGLLYRWP